MKTVLIKMISRWLGRAVCAGLLLTGACSSSQQAHTPPQKEFTFDELLITAKDDNNLETELTRPAALSGWNSWVNDKRPKVSAMARKYFDFLKTVITEADLINAILTMGTKEGFEERELFGPLKSGDLAPGTRLLFTDKDHNNIALVSIGTQKLSSGCLVVTGSMDLPHMLIKQNPVFAKDGMVLLQTSYSGYPRKHQWLSVPLGLAGSVQKQDGRRIQIKTGWDNTPAFVIPDLLPHLARNEQRDMLIKVEDLDVVADHLPLTKQEESVLTRSFLQLLEEKYGVSAQDFITASLELVPLTLPGEVGVDRGFIGGYAQAVKLPAFQALEALSRLKNQPQTAILLLVSGKEPDDDYTTYHTILKSLGTTLLSAQTGTPAGEREVQEFLHKCHALHVGMMSAVNPVFKDGWADVAYGPVLITAMENMDYLGKTLDVFKRKKAVWQMVDKEYRDRELDNMLEKEGMPCLNLLCPILAEGSFFELVSKMDLYLTFYAIKAFLENDFNS